MPALFLCNQLLKLAIFITFETNWCGKKKIIVLNILFIIKTLNKKNFKLSVLIVKVFIFKLMSKNFNKCLFIVFFLMCFLIDVFCLIFSCFIVFDWLELPWLMCLNQILYMWAFVVKLSFIWYPIMPANYCNQTSYS